MVKVTNDQMNTLESMCEGIQDFIKKNFHPHVSIIVEDDCVRVEETVSRLPRES